jgi:hypothetical protein
MGAEFAVLVFAAMVGVALAVAVPCGLIVRRAGYSLKAAVSVGALALLVNLWPAVLVVLISGSTLRAYAGLLALIPTVFTVIGLWWFALGRWPAERS